MLHDLIVFVAGTGTGIVIAAQLLKILIARFERRRKPQ